MAVWVCDRCGAVKADDKYKVLRKRSGNLHCSGAPRLLSDAEADKLLENHRPEPSTDYKRGAE